QVQTVCGVRCSRSCAERCHRPGCWRVLGTSGLRRGVDDDRVCGRCDASDPRAAAAASGQGLQGQRAARAGLMQVAATGYDWLMFLHVLAAMVWLGGAVCVTVFAVVALRSGEADAIDRFLAGMRVVFPLALGPRAWLCSVSGSGLSSPATPGTSAMRGSLSGSLSSAPPFSLAGRWWAGRQTMLTAPRTGETVARRSGIYAGRYGRWE